MLMEECEICGEGTTILYTLRRYSRCDYVCQECLAKANGADYLMSEGEYKKDWWEDR